MGKQEDRTGPDALRGLVIELGSHSNSQMVIGAVLADMGAMADAWAADRAALAQAERELTKWRNWHPDDETLSELQEQARGKSQAGYVTYIAALEQRCRDNAADLAQAQAERDAATVRGNTYRRRALALAQLCRRLENGERILGTGFAVGAARKFVVDEMTARCADCGQMIMLTVQEYIKRRQAPQP